jgi:hypothetical protein
LDSNPAATLVHQWQRPLHNHSNNPNQWEADLTMEAHLVQVTQASAQYLQQPYSHQEAERLAHNNQISQNYKGI